MSFKIVSVLKRHHRCQYAMKFQSVLHSGYIGYWLYFCFHRYYSVILQSVDNHPVFMNRYLNITHRLRNIIPIAAIISLMVTTILYSCTTDKRDLDRMDRSERQMENNPEMALAILDSIDHAKLHGRATKARYALLKSIALDKNYIDTTDFTILQPAIDYYLKHGTPDQKLRTYYYQGCIYMNRNEEDSAMTSYLKGLELSNSATDSLTLTKLHIAKGILHYIHNEIEEVAKADLMAGHIAHLIGNVDHQINALTKAWDNFILLGNKQKSDSLKAICLHLLREHADKADFIIPEIVAHTNQFGSLTEKIDTLEKYSKEYEWIPAGLGTLVHGYSLVGNADKAMHYLEMMPKPATRSDSLCYLARKSEVLETAGRYEEALKIYEDYLYLEELEHIRQLKHNTSFVIEQYMLEREKYHQINRREKIIYAFIIASLLLTLLSLWITYKLKLQKIISSDLKSKIYELETEKYNLNQLLDTKQATPIHSSLKKVLITRVNLLNGIIATEVTQNQSHSTSYNTWLDKIKKDKSEFLLSLRQTLSAMYPKTIAYLMTLDFTEREMDFICLFIIGLSGKEIGVYIENKVITT